MFEEDRFKKRYVREYQLEISSVPVWAVLPLIELLRQEAKRFDYDLLRTQASVTVDLDHVTVEPDDKKAFEPLRDHLDKLWLSFESELLEKHEIRSAAETEAERAVKSGQ